jgi:alpha/beta superfamily hydrolase
MSHTTQKTRFQGAAGELEALVDLPVLSPGAKQRGVAFIAHPHPLFGGTMENKVTQTLARAYAQSGWMAVRFNFRGVGASAGVHDNGLGEAQDFLLAIQHFAPAGEIALAGFSFGAYVVSRVVTQLFPERSPACLVLIGTATGSYDTANIPEELHAITLVVHGEADDTIPLADLMDWARPQKLPVMVMPGVGHFFHGQLVHLRHLVVRHIQSSFI